MKRMRIIGWTAIGVICLSSSIWAHTPYMACFDNGDGTVTCNGDFSDGSSAAGVPMRVVDDQEKLLIQGRMDEDGEFTFQRPDGAFTVIFDGGPNHVVKERSNTIVP